MCLRSEATALSVFGSHLIEQAATGVDRIGTGNRVQTSAPSDVFATRDGHILTHVVGGGLFKRWARLMGDESRWTSDPRFATDQGRGTHGDEILERMRQWCSEHTCADAVARLESAGIPAGRVQTPRQALEDPQVAAMRMLASIEHYPGLSGALPVPDLPVRLSLTPGGVHTRPPTLGEHTDTILSSLGYSDAEISSLRASRAI